MKAIITTLILLVSIIAHGQSLPVAAGCSGFTIGQVFSHDFSNGRVTEGLLQSRERYVFTAIDETKSIDNRISLWPNPFTGTLHFTGDYEIFDLTGRKIMQGLSDGIIDVSKVNSGVYLFRTKKFTKKIIKK